MKALLIADYTGQALRPLTYRTCVALLPVGGKPLVLHGLEFLAAAGIREVIVALSPHAEAVEDLLQDGTRWGLRIEYVLTKGNEPPARLADRLTARLGQEAVIIRGDVLRGFALQTVLESVRSGPEAVVAVRAGGRCAGLWVRLRLAEQGVASTAPAGATGGATIDVLGRALHITTLTGYHRANIEVITGQWPSVILPGLPRAPGLHVGRHSAVPASAVQGSPLLIGAGCHVHPKAELHDGVVLSDHVIVDRHAALRQTVVLPDTYIGAGVDIAHAIVWGQDLIALEAGDTIHVSDPLLLSTVGRPVAAAWDRCLNRTAGLLLMLLSAPLWPLAALAAWRQSPAAMTQARILLGQSGAAEGPPVPFRTFEWETSIPLLRYLPRLLAVCRGHLRLIGVTPLMPEAARRRDGEWQLARDQAPSGLIGPVQLSSVSEDDGDARWLIEAWYAGTRSWRSDLYWLLRGMAALLSRSTWQSASVPTDLETHLVSRRRSARVPSRAGRRRLLAACLSAPPPDSRPVADPITAETEKQRT
jgi:mannose-1-phosphate guanylyltransferase / phosphomannomutase